VSGSALVFHNIHHRYGKVHSVREISFEIQTGEIVCLLGPSGCGKTTLLRLASGLECPDKGEIHINGNMVGSRRKLIPPEKRPISMVFQDYALFPHLNVLQNVVFGLKKLVAEERYSRAREAIARIGLADQMNRFPHTLSGGQQQRVALARAIALRPMVMLMDEPFSNLDTNLRFSVREHTREILKEENAATLLVTHDAEEASHLADRIILMKEGYIVQTGATDDFYFRPNSPFSAHFFGDTIEIKADFRDGALHTPFGKITSKSPMEHGTQMRVVIRNQAFSFRPPDGRDTPANCQVKVMDSRIVGGKRVTRFSVLEPGEQSAQYLAYHRLTTNMKVGEVWPCWVDPQLVFSFPVDSPE